MRSVADLGGLWAFIQLVSTATMGDQKISVDSVVMSLFDKSPSIQYYKLFDNILYQKSLIRSCSPGEAQPESQKATKALEFPIHALRPIHETLFRCFELFSELRQLC
jgi:hypothetical protein